MNRQLYREVGELAERYKEHPNYVDKSDPNNRQILIEKNMKLALEIALKNKNKGVDEEDLIGAAFEGLTIAYDKYKEDKKCYKKPKFSSVAYFWIVAKIKQLINDGEQYRKIDDNLMDKITNVADDDEIWREL